MVDQTVVDQSEVDQIVVHPFVVELTLVGAVRAVPVTDTGANAGANAAANAAANVGPLMQCALDALIFSVSQK